MSIKQYIIIILFLSYTLVCSEEYEFETYKLPTQNNLIAVEFYNNYNGIILSNIAEIYYTDDGGQSWTESNFKLDFIPNSLIFLENGEAVIVGSQETIIKTYDYGINWLVISHIDTSEVVFKSIVSRSPYEVFISEGNSKVLHFTLDGFETMRTYSYEKRSLLKLNPIFYNLLDDNIYTLGEFTRTSIPGPTPNYNYSNNRFISKYFNIVISKGITFSDPSTDNSYLTSYDLLSQINGEVIGANGTYLEKFNIRSFEDKFIYRNEFRVTHVSEFANTGVILDEKGNVIFLEDFYFDDTPQREAHYELNSIQVTDTILYDYHQIKDKKGIVTSVNGKYFMYDNSGVIDSANINDNTDSIPDFSNDSTTTDSEDNIGIYPNPTTDEFTIVFQEKEFINSIKLYDLKGYEVYSKYLNEEYNIYDVKISKLQKGTYFLKITTDNDIFHKKIIKF